MVNMKSISLKTKMLYKIDMVYNKRIQLDVFPMRAS